MILAKCGPEDNIEVALTLPNICTLNLWTDPVAVKTSQLCKIQSRSFTDVYCS